VRTGKNSRPLLGLGPEDQSRYGVKAKRRKKSDKGKRQPSGEKFRWPGKNRAGDLDDFLSREMEG